MNENKNDNKRGLVGSVIHFFDKLEDHTRAKLSHHPIVYALIGGTAIVLFWRGVWNLCDELEKLGGYWGVIFSSEGSIVISVIILMMIGLFVSFFVGDVIIISGLKKEKKIIEKTEVEVREDKEILEELHQEIIKLEAKIKEHNTQHLS